MLTQKNATTETRMTTEVITSGRRSDAANPLTATHVRCCRLLLETVKLCGVAPHTYLQLAVEAALEGETYALPHECTGAVAERGHRTPGQCQGMRLTPHSRSIPPPAPHVMTGTGEYVQRFEGFAERHCHAHTRFFSVLEIVVIEYPVKSNQVCFGSDVEPESLLHITTRKFLLENLH